MSKEACVHIKRNLYKRDLSKSVHTKIRIKTQVVYYILHTQKEHSTLYTHKNTQTYAYSNVCKFTLRRHGTFRLVSVVGLFLFAHRPLLTFIWAKDCRENDTLLQKDPIIFAKKSCGTELPKEGICR